MIDKLSDIYYIKVHKNKLHVKNIKTDEEKWVKDIEFSSEKLLICDFNKALDALNEAISSKKLLRPIIIIQPMSSEKLCSVEEQIFRELAIGCGGRKSLLHVGKELDINSENFVDVLDRLNQ